MEGSSILNSIIPIITNKISKAVNWDRDLKRIKGAKKIKCCSSKAILQVRQVCRYKM